MVKGKSVIQEWVSDLTMMQQTVLLTCVRGPDGMAKYSSPKFIGRWLRRCILLSAMDGKVFTNPLDHGGGSFTGPSVETGWSGWSVEHWKAAMCDVVDNFVRDEDCIPSHFMAHIRNGAQILGYKHPDQEIRVWWNQFYLRLVNLLHLYPETEEEMDKRLGDSLEGWQARGDAATEK
jgi:hypothetical protein